LARAFQLMSQALSEFRAAVGQEALRLRMVAMHGREDPLLEASRFPRLLRQANDAEVADVRKLGDDDYEIAAQRTSSRGQMQLPAPREEAPPSPPAGDTGSETPSTREPAAGSRDNGQRFGVRFRRGSRGPLRAGEIPLIGVVQIEPPEMPVPEASAEPVPEAKRARPKRAPRKRAAAAPATAAGPTAEAAESPPAKRPRTRPRKKTE
jgi:hypothetical protein